MISMDESVLSRLCRQSKQLINKYQLDLNGLTVLTEGATGAYSFNPFIAIMGRAQHVYAFSKPTDYGNPQEIAINLNSIAAALGCQTKIEPLSKLTEYTVRNSDIITNSGMLRPINRDIIEWMKPTAVVPLMWETWEYRLEDISIFECQRKGILVLGTNEHRYPCDMRPYSGLMAIKELFNHSFEIHQNKFLLLGDQPTLGASILNYLYQLGATVDWFGESSEKSLDYGQLLAHFIEHGNEYDAIIVAEHIDKRKLIGSKGILTGENIKNLNPFIELIIISGNVEAQNLKDNSITLHPDVIRPVGYMSLQPDNLGPLPIMDLFTAGLKVGESMSRARLKGLSINDSAQFALNNSPAMDFDGDLAWIKKQ